MKKVLVLLVGLGLVISCDKEEALDDSSNTFDTTSIMAIVESGNNNTSRDVNRPGSVLDWIETINITAEHIYDINQPDPNDPLNNGATPGPYYTVSEDYTMVDDGSGDDNFILKDVALGRNKFSAYAESKNQTGAKEFEFIENTAETPWEWVDLQRLRQPNTNFYDNDNDLQDIYEDPDADQNVVNFQMQAESGRLIVGIRLAQEVRETLNSNFVYVRHRINGGAWSGMKFFNAINRNDLLTFYWSDNSLSIHDAEVEFEFNVCDWVPDLVTNTFSKKIKIQNGKSIGCVYEVTKDAVVEDINEINFTFDWQEIDCSDDCTDDNYVIVLDRYEYIQQEMLTLCGLQVGSFHDITADFPVGSGAVWHEEPILNLDGTASDVSMVVNMTTNRNITMTFDNGSITVPAGKRYLVKLPENTTINEIKVDGYSKGSRTTGAIIGCN
jgi:hypothetical protein